MPPRHAYWTIILEGKPTAFRAHTRDELAPTLRQLQARHPDAVLMWFARGRLWESPEQEREAQARRRGGREKRGPDWRPGGTHEDPRARFRIPRDEKRRRFSERLRRDRVEPRDNRPPGDARPTGPRGTRPPGDARPGGPRGDRPRGRPGERQPARPSGPRPGWKDQRPQRPEGDRGPWRPPGTRPRGPRPFDDRPREDRDRRPSDRRPPEGGKSGPGTPARGGADRPPRRPDRRPGGPAGQRGPGGGSGPRGGWRKPGGGRRGGGGGGRSR